MPEPHIIVLRRPVGPKGQEISELRLREPRTGEVLKASREMGRSLALALLTQVTGANEAAILALPGRVTDQALAHLMTFIEPVLTAPGNDASGEAPTEELLEEMTIDLVETIQVGTTWVPKLDLREPTLGELIKADRYEGMQRTVVLVALASGLPRSVIEMVPISDFAKAAAFVLGFTKGVQPDGGGSLAA